MKTLSFLFSLFILVSCASEPINSQPPVAPWTYPELQYQAIKVLADRKGEMHIARLVGWDGEYYYFDWSQPDSAITRGTAKVLREDFNLKNRGALTEAKGEITVSNGQVTTIVRE